MVISKEALAKIRKIIHKHYSSLLISLVGNSTFTEEEKSEMSKLGVDIENPSSLLDLIYFHNILNQPDSKIAPLSISEMKRQQKDLPPNKLQEAAVEHINHNFRNLVEDLRADMQAKVEGIVRDENHRYRNRKVTQEIPNLNIDKLIQESTVGQIKQRLRDFTGDSDRNWQRVAITEVSNAISMGSVDRIVSEHPDKPAEVLVYKIIVDDAATCKHCYRFFVDTDGTPAVYRMGDLLANGTNLGRKVAEWKAVVGPIHPHCRESGLIELKPGWKVVSGGKMEYIGLDKWKSYTVQKIRN